MVMNMWPFKKKTRREILTEELLRFKRRVEKRFGWKEGYGFGPFVKPFVEWNTETQGAVEWNDVKVMLFFSTDDSDMGVNL